MQGDGPAARRGSEPGESPLSYATNNYATTVNIAK